MLHSTIFRICILLTTFVVVMKTNSDDNGNATFPRSLSQNKRIMVKEAGYSYVDRLTQLEEDLYAQGLHVKEGSSMSTMAKFKRPSPEVIDLSRSNMRFIETVRYLKNDLGLKEEDIERNIWDGEFDSGCLSDPVCPKSEKYRTIDGSCNRRDNNLKNLGRSVSGYRRFQKPAYYDGVWSPRNQNPRGDALPNPRLVSMNVFTGSDRPLKEITSLLMQFGQFINHDLESTSQFTFRDGTGFSCCGERNEPLNPSILNSLVNCWPITIPKGDSQLQNGQDGCMNFVRSSIGPNRISCSFPFAGHAEQLNQNTHWLDASTVYGSNIETMTALRNTSNGMLNVYIDSNGHTLLPINPCDKAGCPLYIAGDSRVNEQPQLTVIHTIWMREHNRIAKILSNLNPTWSSETVFQEARRIVIAELQHITYNEFLPNLLGASSMGFQNEGLWPMPGNNFFRVFVNESLKENEVGRRYFKDHVDTYYKSPPTTSGPISNEFATAAFRMGHSLVQGNIQLIDANGQVTRYNMRNFFNNPILLSDPFFFDNSIRGLVNQHSQTVDTQITDDLWQHLFENLSSGYRGESKSSILDIIALNIQRGRDHGLPGYNSYLKQCLRRSFNVKISNLPTKKPILNDPSIPITPYFDPWVVNALSKLYVFVDDIDLYVGGLAEISPLDDGLLGPTFLCIIQDTFLKLKYEDRYFYEAGKGYNPYPFTPDQLIEIKKSSMARILCDNNDGTVSTIQPNAFLVPSDKNPIVNCIGDDRIPNLNLNLWKA